MPSLTSWFILMTATAPLGGRALLPAASSQAPSVDASESAAKESLPTFAPDDFLLLPLRIHVLRAAELPLIDTQLKDEDIFRILGKANRVWQQAGIRFVIEQVMRESAADPKKFELAHSLKPEGWSHYLALRPETSQAKNMLHVYLVHEMNVNGVYLGHGVAFVKETARLREVAGGIDEPIPRVMSHELGHALGLPHRQDRTNLLASGTTGTSLNAVEIRRARELAGKVESASTAGDQARRAKEHYEAGRWSDALALDTELVTLPGSSPLKDDAWVRCTVAKEHLRGRHCRGAVGNRD